MCIDPATAATIAITLAGAKVQQNAVNAAESRRQRAEEAAVMEQQGFQRKAQDSLLDAAGQYNATDREQALQTQQATAGDKLRESVVSNQLPQLGEGAALQGVVSKEFSALQGQRALESLKKAAETAKLMGNLRGLDMLKTKEAGVMGDSAVDQGLTGAVARSQWNARQPGISNAGKVNSGQMILGQVLQSAAGPASMKLFPGASPGGTNDFGLFSGSGTPMQKFMRLGKSGD